MDTLFICLFNLIASVKLNNELYNLDLLSIVLLLICFLLLIVCPKIAYKLIEIKIMSSLETNSKIDQTHSSGLHKVISGHY